MNIKKGFETILPIPLWILLFTGFLSGGYTRERNFIRIFLLSTAAPLAVLIVFYYISYGYNEAYLPVMFLWTASGFLVIESWLKLRISPYLSVAQNDLIGRIPLLIAVSAIYSVTLIVPQLTRKDISDAEYVIEMDNGRRAEKLIGILLKDSLPPGKIMTRWARIAFYAERESMSIPLGVEYDGIIKLAYENGVRFLIADCMLYENRPALGLELFGPFMDKGLPIGRFFNDDTEARVKGLRPFMVYTDQRKNVGVVVYELP